MSARLAALTARLGLDDEEALAIFRLDALEAIGGGDLEHRPEIAIVDALTSEAAELAGEGALRRWLRSEASTPTALERLQRGEFAEFEQELSRWLSDSGVGAAG